MGKGLLTTIGIIFVTGIVGVGWVAYHVLAKGDYSVLDVERMAKRFSSSSPESSGLKVNPGRVSGLDLLDDPSAQDMKEEAMGLIAGSARKLADLLAFSRIAFGASASAETFDRTYIDQQVAAHQEALTLHRGFADSDSPLAAHARSVAPKIEAHLQRAQQIQSSM